ncbi:MAG: DUF3179 domain-containing (seleno)protein [Dehalococcoidia bacterium]
MRRRALGGSLAVVVALLAGVGCIAEELPTGTPTPTEATVFRPVTNTEPTATPPPPLTEDEIDEVLRDIVCWYDDPALAQECLPPGEEFLAQMQRIALSEDRKFIAPLVDMLWLDVGWERWVREALERVSGERFATASEWYAWMLTSAPELPEGYGEWKGRLLAVIDPSLQELIPDASAFNGPGPEALIWSLVRADAVPPLVDAPNVHRVEELYLSASDIVYGVEVDGVQRAYPERIIGWHGSVADTVNGVRILLWHCPVCGGAAVFNRLASDGQAYTFVASGLVWDSRRLFRDEETSSLWDAVSGRAVAGPLAEAGVHLVPRVSVRTTWGDWSERYPNTRVLSLDTGFVRDYSPGAYEVAALEGNESPAFPVARLDERLPAMTPVFAVTAGGARKAYPLAAVESAGILRDTVGDTEIVIVSAGPGRGATAYQTLGTVFVGMSGPPADRVLTDADELTWFVSEERLLNTRNSRVRTSVPAQVAYWFAWSGAFPDTAVWTP